MPLDEPADEILGLGNCRRLVTVAARIDSLLPHYDVSERHETIVDAPVDRTFQAIRNVDLGTSPIVLALMAIRGLPHLITGKAKFSRHLKIDALTDLGFVILSETPPTEIVLGAIGRFWQLNSGLIPFEAADFESFDKPGYAKAVMNFMVEPVGDGTSTVVTETRVSCTGPESLRRFKIYWTMIGPFSGLIRRLLLRSVKRDAEG